MEIISRFSTVEGLVSREVSNKSRSAIRVTAIAKEYIMVGVPLLFSWYSIRRHSSFYSLSLLAGCILKYLISDWAKS